MSDWYQVIHYGVFFIPAFFAGFAYVAKWRPTISNIAFALMLLVAMPALYVHSVARIAEQHEALALGCGFLAGYLATFVGRILIRIWDRQERFLKNPPYDEVTRPWHSLLPAARVNLRAPGELGVYNDDRTLKPLRLKGGTCDIHV